MELHQTDSAAQPLELWGGLECTVNRVQDRYFSQMERNGHAHRDDDLERFASLGIRAVRYPVLWERIAPDGLDKADWSWPDERLPGLRDLGITPIVGLIHHGSGPRHTSLVDPGFAEDLAEYAGAVAARYPWVEYYTPVNEPLTTARFSGLYGVWYPHGQDERSFIQALINQCRAVVLSMREIRKINPNAKLVQTDDISKTYSTPEMAELAEFYNHRRWLCWDLLCGMVDENHALWDYLTGTGIEADEFLWFKDNPCPPDIIGLNYYVTSERWLDHRTSRYPGRYCINYRGFSYADIETARVLATPTPGIAPLVMETWERYGLAMAVTEAHIDSNREDQMRWLVEIWEAAKQAKAAGADMRAVTVWALLGSFDWNCLVTQCKGYYEPGPFDVRGKQPRPTAVAGLMRELSAGRPLSHPVLHGQGWWRRQCRFFAKPVSSPSVTASIATASHDLVGTTTQPILIVGATGTLGRAFARICEQRSLAHRVLTRQELDITDAASVERAIAHHQPWAIINAGGYVRVDEAERDAEMCFRGNTQGAALLAAVCARYKLQLLTFSSDLVFDGSKQTPYVESDPVAPLNIYGRSKADAERKIQIVNPDALVVRTSSFFGPWDRHNFLTQAMKALARGEAFTAASDMIVTPTYVPDLVHVCLDLLIDRESGIWHLSNGQAVSWAELARRACEIGRIDAGLLQERPAAELGLAAPRPSYSALHSERAQLMPSLDDALHRYFHMREDVELAEESRQAVGAANS